jgi:hypothetical protein
VLAAGLPHGVLTYGYKRQYGERGHLVGQVEDEDTAAVVRDIFASVARGEPLRSISIRLTREGVPTPKGGLVWYGSTLTRIVRNESYRPHPADPDRGRRSHRGVVLSKPAAWPPLVDETIWGAANRVLGANDERARHGRRDSAPGHVKYLLSGNADIMAAPCGSLLTGWSNAAGRGASYACRHDRCVSSPMPECDEFVSRLVVARMSKKDARALWVSDDTATRAAADELARLRADLAENEHDYKIGVISANLAGPREQELLALIAEAERRARPVGTLAALELVEAAEMGAETVRPTWDRFPVAAKREIVAGIFASLVLGPMTKRMNRWTSDEERLDIVSERITFEWSKPA